MALRWIAPWIIAMLRSHRIQDIEIDASFKAVRPHCFLVPLRAVGNCGVPLGLVVSPTEKAQSYHMFYDTLIQADPSLSLHLEDLPILSDLRSGLASLAGALSKHHFLCYCHVLERLGLRTYLAIFAGRLLFTGSRAEYYKTKADVWEDLKCTVQLRIIAVEGLNSLCDFLGMNPRTLDGEGIDRFRDQAL
jgi:hypothetical protein